MKYLDGGYIHPFKCFLCGENKVFNSGTKERIEITVEYIGFEKKYICNNCIQTVRDFIKEKK